jgi:transposase-like protein
MEASISKLRQRRIFDDAVKKSAVRSFEKGEASVRELSGYYNVSTKSIYRWIYKFGSLAKQDCQIVEYSMSSAKKVKELEARINELEQKIGQKQIMIDYLETMMEVAKNELNIDIKKNFDTSQSGKSGKNVKK